MGTDEEVIETSFLSTEQVHVRRVSSARQGRVLKRGLDVLLASGLLLFLAPLLLAIGCLISWNGGPVLYGSRRIGQSGKEFQCLKFRTMRPDAERVLREWLAADPTLREEWETNFKLEKDPRITRLGRVLRTSSIDEMPQLINVIKGEMSLVGPRPLLLDEISIYPAHSLDLYTSVKPGITGMWQVNGRDDVAHEKRIEFNDWYIRNCSLWVDVQILMRTIVVVIGRRGAS